MVLRTALLDFRRSEMHRHMPSKTDFLSPGTGTVTLSATTYQLVIWLGGQQGVFHVKPQAIEARKSTSSIGILGPFGA
jgi:hypothetical protein